MTPRPDIPDAIFIVLVFIAAFSVPMVDAVIHSNFRWLGITVVLVAAASAVFLVLSYPSRQRD